MSNPYEYDVYYHRLPASMSEEEEVITDEAEEVVAETEKGPSTVQLEGYTTVFDIKVSLTPVELIPLSEKKTGS